MILNSYTYVIICIMITQNTLNYLFITTHTHTQREREREREREGGGGGGGREKGRETESDSQNVIFNYTGIDCDVKSNSVGQIEMASLTGRSSSIPSQYVCKTDV